MDDIEQLSPKSDRPKSNRSNSNRSNSSKSNNSAPKTAALRVMMDGSVSSASSTSPGKTNDSAEEKEQALAGSSVISVTETTAPANAGRRCSTGRILCFLVVILIIAAAIAVPLVLLLPNSNSSTDGIQRIKGYKNRDVVSELSTDLCYDWVPGEGKSEICSAQDTATQGGVLCNLVAQAMLSVTDGADMAIVNAGVCKKDIAQPEMTGVDIKDALYPADLVKVDISGGDVLKLLEQSIVSTFFADGGSEAYPYAAGLRYVVRANKPEGERVSNVEIDVDLMGIYRPINPRRFYTVITTAELAKGELGYEAFENVIPEWKTKVDYTAADAFLTYSLQGTSDSDEQQTGEWYELSPSLYSTQLFVGPDVALAIAAVEDLVCLEWAPGTGKSEMCEPGETQAQGGGACNLVGWALLDQQLTAQIAILKAEDCGSDIAVGKFTEEDANTLIPGNPDLVTVQLGGYAIISLLENVIDVVVASSRPEAYPYAAGLRFDVDASASAGARISNLEVYNINNRWTTIDPQATYTVLTTKTLADGEDPAYAMLATEANGLPSPISKGASDVFVAYAKEWEMIYDPPKEKYSTQSYIS